MQQQQHRSPQEDESVEFSSSRKLHGFDWVTQNFKGEVANNLAQKSPVSQQGIVKSSENFSSWAAMEATTALALPFVFLLQWIYWIVVFVIKVYKERPGGSLVSV